jgi:hypothetical protein
MHVFRTTGGVKRRALMSFIALAAIAGALQAASGSAAGAATVQVSGGWTVTSLGDYSCDPDGPPFVLRCSTTGFTTQYSGSLVGTTTVDFVQIIDCATGRTLGHGLETFTGSIVGVGSGTLTWRIHFSSEIDCATFELSNFSGRGVVVSGSGSFADLNGSIEFGIDSYEGELH